MCVCVCVCVCVRVRVCACVHVCVCACIHTCKRTCVGVCRIFRPASLHCREEVRYVAKNWVLAYELVAVIVHTYTLACAWFVFEDTPRIPFASLAMLASSPNDSIGNILHQSAYITISPSQKEVTPKTKHFHDKEQ